MHLGKKITITKSFGRRVGVGGGGGGGGEEVGGGGGGELELFVWEGGKNPGSACMSVPSVP